MNKKIFSSIIIINLFLISVLIHSFELDYSFEVNMPTLEKSGKYDLIMIKDLPQESPPDKPVLPSKMLKLLLPPKALIKNISVKRKESVSLGKTLNLMMDQSKHLSQLPSPKNQQELSFSNFLVNNVYPPEYSYWSVQKFHGYNILLLKVHPVYITESKEIFYAEEVSLKINLELEENTIDFTQGIHPEVAAFIDNKYFYSPSPYEYTAKKDDYDYLILTTSDLLNYKGKNSLFDFKNYLENTRKLEVKIQDIGKILIKTNEEMIQSIRNFIRDQYKKHKIKYVLLAGDADRKKPAVPSAIIHTYVYGYNNYTWKKLNDIIPCDYYYSCLDGEYSIDRINQEKEISIGNKYSHLDFLSEVSIGRFPVDNHEELSIMVAKTIQSYRQLKSRPTNLLQVGEVVFRNMGIWGKDYLNKLVGLQNHHGFVTNGFDHNWKITEICEKDKPWNTQDLKTQLLTGDFLIVNGFGHSFYNRTMKISDWSFAESNKPKPFFLYNEGCHAGFFLQDDCIIEKMMLSDCGPFAAVAYSTYALVPEDPAYFAYSTPGIGLVLHRFYTDRLLRDESYLTFGEAHRHSKHDILAYIDHPQTRWTIWGANYFGDPALGP